MAGNDNSDSGKTNLDPKVAESIDKAMRAARDSASSVTSAFEQQLKIITQLRDAMASISGDMQKMCNPESGGMSSENWQKVTKSVDEATKSTQAMTKATEEAAKATGSKLSKAAIVTASALAGLKKGFSNLTAMTKSITGLFSSIAGGIFSVGKAIVTAPIKMLSGLVKMANSGGGGDELAAAYENVREQFGSLQSESSRTVIDVAKNMDKQNETGVSAFRIFGNLAARIEAVNKVATAMGNTFQVFQKEIHENGVAIMMYQKGLGLTEEQMQSVGFVAMRMGKGVAEVQNEMTKQAMGMSKAFGVNAKVLSKDMGKAMQDLAHFGHLSTKEMAVAATFAQKLGVSVDKLTAIMDATATFDQAAEGMSKLNEQFGTNIDASKIMEAQNPAEKVEMLRKEFAATGKDMSKMTYQEKMLIKQSTGLDDAMLAAAFSAKTAGVSLESISKQGDKNESKTLSQAEAMKYLGDEIKRLTPSGGGGGGGFLDHIVRGFKNAIMTSPEFLKIMENIRRVLVKAEMFGYKLGKMFVDLFPGVKDIMKGLGDMFNPARYQRMFDGVLKTFDVFKAGGSGKMEDFIKKLQDVFFNFFNEGKPAGKQVLGGFKKFGEAILKIFGALGKMVVDKLAVVIQDVADWLKKPKIPEGAGAVVGIGSSILDLFVSAFRYLGTKLGPPLKDLGLTILNKLKDFFLDTTIGKSIIGGALAILFGPMLLSTIGGIVASGVFKKAGGLLASGLGSGLSKGVEAASGASKGAAALKAGTEATAQAVPSKDATSKLEDASKAKINFKSVGAMLLGLAGMMAIGLVAFKQAIQITKGLEMKDILIAGAVLAAVAWSMEKAADGAASLIRASNTYGKEKTNIIQGLLAVAGVMAIGLVAFNQAIKMVKEQSITTKDLAIAGLLFLEIAGIITVFGLLAAGIVVLGKFIVQNKKEAIAGFLAIAAIMEIGVTPFLSALSILASSKDAASLSKSVSSLFWNMLGVMAVAGLVAVEAGLLGALILNVPGGPLFVVAGLIAMAQVMLTGLIPFTAALIIIKASGASTSDIDNVAKMFNALGPMMAISAAVALAAIPLGVAVIVAAPVIIAGLVAMAGVMIGGILLFINAVKELRKANINVQDINTINSVLNVMKDMFKTAIVFIGSAVALGLVIIPAAIPTLAGMAALVTVMDGIVSMGSNIIMRTSILDLSKLGNVYKVMELMSDLFKQAMVFIGVAALLGQYMIATVGVGAVAILAGLATIKIVVDNSVDTVIGLMTKLSQINEEPNALLAKTDAFTKIMKSISEFSNSIGIIFKSMDFGFFDTAEGKARQLGEAQKVIKTMIEGEGGKGGIIGFVTVIIEGLKSLSIEKIKAAEPIANIIGSAAQLISALAGPVGDMQKNVSTSWQSHPVEDNLAQRQMVETVQNYITTVMGSVKELITAVIKEIGQIKGDPHVLEKAGPIISGSLQAAASMISAIMPALKDMTRIDSSGAKSIDPQAIYASGAAVKSIISSLTDKQTGLLQLVNNVMGMVQGINVSQLNPAKIEAMTKIVGILGTVTGAAASIMAAFKPQVTETSGESTRDVKGNSFVSSNDVKEMNKTTSKVTAAGPSFVSTIGDMTKNIPTLLSAIQKAVADIPMTNVYDQTFTKKLDQAVKMFEIVKTISEFFGNLTKASEANKPKESAKGEAATESIVKPFEGWGKTIASVASAIMSLTSADSLAGFPSAGNAKSPIEFLGNALKIASEKVGKVGFEDGKKVADFLENVSKIHKTFSDTVSSVGVSGEDSSKRIEEMKKGWWESIASIASALQSVSSAKAPDGAKSPAGLDPSLSPTQALGKYLGIVSGQLQGIDNTQIKAIAEKMTSISTLSGIFAPSSGQTAATDTNAIATQWRNALISIGNAISVLNSKPPPEWGDAKNIVDGVLGFTNKAKASLDLIKLDALEEIKNKIKVISDFQTAIENKQSEYKIVGNISGWTSPMDVDTLASMWWWVMVRVGNALYGLYREDGPWTPPNWQEGALQGTITSVIDVKRHLGRLNLDDLTSIKTALESINTFHAAAIKIENASGTDIETLANNWWYIVARVGNALWGLYRTDGKWKPADWNSNVGVLEGTKIALDEVSKYSSVFSGEKINSVTTILTQLNTLKTQMIPLQGFESDKFSSSLVGMITSLDKLGGTGADDKNSLLYRVNQSLTRIMTLGDKIAPDGLAPAIKAVGDIVKATQELDNALNMGSKGINIAAKLEAFASKAGLGAQGVYTVQSKEVVINVAFTVTMDAGEVEKVIISRRNSVIRDRINYLLETPQIKTNPDAAGLRVNKSGFNIAPAVSNYGG